MELTCAKNAAEPDVLDKFEFEATGKGTRRDVLRQIDMDLLAVEEALDRRRKSLADIDKKLNDLQLPAIGAGSGDKVASIHVTPRVGPVASATPPAPQNSCGTALSSPTKSICSVSLRTTTAASPAASAAKLAGIRVAAQDPTPSANATPTDSTSFADWLREHREFCTGIQQARKIKEVQERTWQQRREQLQNQLSLLQSQLTSTTCGIDKALPFAPATQALPVPVASVWRGPVSAPAPLNRSVQLPVRSPAAVKPCVGVIRSRSWSVPPVQRLLSRSDTKQTAQIAPLHATQLGLLGQAVAAPQMQVLRLCAQQRSMSTPTLHRSLCEPTVPEADAKQNRAGISSRPGSARTPPAALRATCLQTSMATSVAGTAGIATTRSMSLQSSRSHPRGRSASPLPASRYNLAASSHHAVETREGLLVRSQSLQNKVPLGVVLGGPCLTSVLSGARSRSPTPSRRLMMVVQPTNTPSAVVSGGGLSSRSLGYSLPKPLELTPVQQIGRGSCIAAPPNVGGCSAQQQATSSAALPAAMPQPTLFSGMPISAPSATPPPPLSLVPSMRPVVAGRQCGGVIDSDRGVTDGGRGACRGDDCAIGCGAHSSCSASKLVCAAQSFVFHKEASPRRLGTSVHAASFEMEMSRTSRPASFDASLVGGGSWHQPQSMRIASMDLRPADGGPRNQAMESAAPPVPPKTGDPCRQGVHSDSFAMQPLAPPPPPRRPTSPGFVAMDYPVTARLSSCASNNTAYPQSFTEVNLGSFAEGLEQWRPPPSVGSFRTRAEAAFAPGAAASLGGGPNETYNGPQPLPRSQPQCPVQ